MGLFNLFKKDKNNTTKSEPIKKPITSSPKKQIECLEDGDLPFGWYSHHSSELKNWEDILPDLAKASRTGSIDSRLESYKKLISHYNKFKDYCYSQNECYIKYFQDMWEHCHNSRNSDFEYIAPFIQEYEELLANRDKIHEEEIRKEKNMIGLEDKILNILRNNDGILQKELYKQFDSSVKNEISEKLYFWSKEGIIRREKSGNTYKLYIK